MGNSNFNDDAEMAKWRRIRDRQESDFEDGKENLQRYLSRALKNKKTWNNLIKDEIDSRKNPTRQTHRTVEGFNPKDDISPNDTGYPGTMPWLEGDSDDFEEEDSRTRRPRRSLFDVY